MATLLAEKSTNIFKREPVVIVAALAGIVTDALSGTGPNSTWTAVVVAILVAALRFFVTSPATAEQQVQTIEQLEDYSDKVTPGE